MGTNKVHPLQLQKLYPLPELINLVHPIKDPIVDKTIDLIRWYFEVIEQTIGNDYVRFMINLAWFSAMQDGSLSVKLAPEFQYCFNLIWVCPVETCLIFTREESAGFNQDIPRCCTISWEKCDFNLLPSTYWWSTHADQLFVSVPQWFRGEMIARVKELRRVCLWRYPHVKDVCYYTVFASGKEERDGNIGFPISA